MNSIALTGQGIVDKLTSPHIKPDSPPLTVNPCANVDVKKRSVCPRPGTRACSSCRLVSYCSKECQKVHWKVHKQDCKNILLAESWKPIWVREHRAPRFINNDTAEQEFAKRQKEGFSIGLSLWGNTPALDVINLKHNEDDATKDFRLAFAGQQFFCPWRTRNSFYPPASGDLRHVMKTINVLPDDYSGHLEILLNDSTARVVSRNVVLLLILSTISDESIAADVALHFWYSAFIPMEYKLLISSAICQFLPSIVATGKSIWKLGPLAFMSCHDLYSTLPFFQQYVEPSDNISAFQAEYDRVRQAPSRLDFRDRMYSQLRPSHRVAFQEYRRFGVVLPFAAVNAHFNVANQSLFSFNGQWLQTDYADPLAGWDIEDVVKTGRECGAQPEDIYGCLYFFLTQQLRTMARRLRQFKVSFILTNLDASALAIDVKTHKFETYGISASSHFDRIHVSNILDANYVGIEDVLKHWSSLLAQTRTAVIVGYFMNWVALQEDGRACGAKEHVKRKIMDRMIEDGKANLPLRPTESGRRMSPVEMQNIMQDMQTALYVAMSSLDLYYDNSAPFATFLEKQGLSRILNRNNLQLRDTHTIVPHRMHASMKGKPNDLPEFSEDSWYYTTSVLSLTGVERFVEFSRR